jgi:hypothetical protein
MELAAALFGLAIGFVVGAVGAGGSVLAVPVLVYLLDQDVEHATTTALVVVSVAALAGGAQHAGRGRVCWRHVGLFVVSATPGIVTGTVVGGAIGGSGLIAAFGGIMFVAAAAMWQRARDDDADSDMRCPPVRTAYEAAVAGAVGFVTGLLGVGGGFLIVPALAILFAFAMRLAVGTSLAVIAMTSAIALASHLVAGRELDAGITLAMAGACAVGAASGAMVAGRVPQPAVARAFAALLVVLGGYLIASAAFLGGPPS